MYLVGATKPDISFAISKLSRFTSNPRRDHWCALERAMRYLRGTSTYELHYIGYPAVLEGYNDSNWILDADEIKTTSGYIFTICGVVVSWRSHEQTILTKSTIEVERVALEIATIEDEWLKELLMDSSLVDKSVLVILLHCDNQSVIQLLAMQKKIQSSQDM
jgi:hypothetical protein